MKNRYVHSEGGVLWDADENSIGDWLAEPAEDIRITPGEEETPDEGVDIVTLRGMRIGIVESF